MADRLSGARVERLRRRSKYILADLSTDETLIIHLGMSGRMIISAGDGASAGPGVFHHAHPAPEKHDHVVLDTDAGARITFNDARRFGAMDLAPTAEVDAHWLLKGIGPEPLGKRVQRRSPRDRVQWQAHAGQIGTSGSAHRRGPRQYLRV
jgi:formamidopyrimidine-DNA glycosylase